MSIKIVLTGLITATNVHNSSLLSIVCVASFDNFYDLNRLICVSCLQTNFLFSPRNGPADSILIKVIEIRFLHKLQAFC